MGENMETEQTSEAGLKRSIARRFNDALAGTTSKEKGVDQRSARRLNRYRKELTEGKKNNGQELSPLDVTLRVHELLKSGSKIADIRKLSKPRVIDYDEEKMTYLLKEMHPEYGFSPAAYRFAGVHDETLVAAGILETIPAKRGPKKKTEVMETEEAEGVEEEEEEIEEKATKAVPPIRRKRGRSK